MDISWTFNLCENVEIPENPLKRLYSGHDVMTSDMSIQRMQWPCLGPFWLANAFRQIVGVQFLQHIHVWETNTVTFSRHTDQPADVLPPPSSFSPLSTSLFSSPPTPCASSSCLSSFLLCGQFQRNSHNYKKRCQQWSVHASLHYLPVQPNRDKWITASFVVMLALWWQMVH